MTNTQIPETIENDWNILYRDFPEIYDRFARSHDTPTTIEAIHQHFPLTGKTVVDIGSGTGLSTFELAHYARTVIGVEPEAAMRAVSLQAAQERGITNIRILEGSAERIPLEDHAVDLAAAIFLASLYTEENIVNFMREAERVVKPGGMVATANLAPQWYGGELAPIIRNMTPDDMSAEQAGDRLFATYGYTYLDFFQIRDYGTVQNAVETYGFIFGKRAIEHIKAHQKTAIRWKIRLHYKQVS